MLEKCIGFKVYNTLINAFNKNIIKVIKHFLKCYKIHSV